MSLSIEPLSPTGSPLSAADLETVLDAWQTATASLELTHRALREEVCRLTDELEIKNRELARKNRLADLGQMASHVAHEVRNNLVPVSLYLSLLRRRITNDARSQDLIVKLESGLTSLDSMVNDLLQFTADREPKLSRCRLRELVDEVVASLQLQLGAQAIEVEVHVAKDLELFADRDMLRRAVLNLALNAVDAMPNGGKLGFEAERTDGAIEFRVADTGGGLSEEAQRRAFEPFYTTKNTGTGLGLAIVWRVAETHGGACSLANNPRGGAIFTLRLPLSRRQEAAA